MGTSSLFASLQLDKPQQKIRWFSMSLATLLLCFSLFSLVSPVLGAQSHGCAPDTPPPVPNATPIQALPAIVLINEVLSQPKSKWNCSEPSSVFSAPKDSWIELFNPQNQALDLYAAHAQISLNGGSTSAFLPFGSAIAAKSFLVIFPLENQTVAPPAMWNVVLSIEGTIIDQVAIPLLQPDQSYARVPDGSTTWLYAGTPTIDGSNNASGQPVTPTPTRTPTPTKTPKLPTPTKTTGASITGGSGASQPSNFGTQPAWTQVQFPPDPTPTATTTDSSTLSLFSPPQNPPTPQSNSPNAWLIALIIFLSLLVLAALAWRWRFFTALIRRWRFFRKP